jgi:hypothetical protein
VALVAERRLATAALAAGLGLAALSALSGPAVSRPLYDGVVVAEPYRWLDPPPGLKGGAEGVRDVVPAQGGGISVATTETPPQAQVDPDYSALSLPPGTTSIAISIRPIRPPAVPPSDGVIAGNVYDLEVVNQRGETVSVAAGQRVTMLFRGPSPLPTARIERYGDGVWSAQETDPAGVPDMYTTLVDAFGLYALVAPPGWAPAGVRGTALSTASAASSNESLTSSANPTSGPTAPVERESSAATETATFAGSGTASPGGSSISPLAAIAIVLAVLAAAVLVLRRPVEPPRG